jgi:hypothetical protein
MSDGLEEFGQEFGPVFPLAVIADRELQIELWRFEQQPKRPRVVDVIADVGGENDRSRAPLRGRGEERIWLSDNSGSRNGSKMTDELAAS